MSNSYRPSGTTTGYKEAMNSGCKFKGVYCSEQQSLKTKTMRAEGTN